MKIKKKTLRRWAIKLFVILIVITMLLAGFIVIFR